MKIGAYYFAGECCFKVWAPLLKNVEIEIIKDSGTVILPLGKENNGYWHIQTKDAAPGDKYLYKLEPGNKRPDPASFYQPQGVHHPSEIIDHDKKSWKDSGWKGLPLEQMCIYEIHIGTFSPEGTFKAVIPRLAQLKEIGINAIEIMPVSQFPGERNWGYDGVYPFSVQNSYGGPEGLKDLVDSCHLCGIAVILDVVYNHLGPEGNYLCEFAPYFTDKYRTPWGAAINFDGPYSRGVRKYFIENALYWLEYYHIDALRLDAIHGIYDFGARHILSELKDALNEFSKTKGRDFYLIAESDLNDVKIIQKKQDGGFGLDAQWNDDFHHSLHTLLTKENTGYYADFGKMEHFVKACREGFVYSWQYSDYRKRFHGSPSVGIPSKQFVVFSQNHDQVGNRMRGERLSNLLCFEALKLNAAAALLSPGIPLIFMGEEYAEDSPFLYFISHTDLSLIEAVRNGRRREFEGFNWPDEVPDPQDPQAFLRSKINWQKRLIGSHKIILSLYKELISLRRKNIVLDTLSNKNVNTAFSEAEKTAVIHRQRAFSHIACVYNFSEDIKNTALGLPDGRWIKQIDTSEEKWSGAGSSCPDILKPSEGLPLKPFQAVLYSMEESK